MFFYILSEFGSWKRGNREPRARCFKEGLRPA